MEKTETKPTFKGVVAVTTIELDDGLVFNSQRVGPMNFNGLRQADYGLGFRMPTMPELVQLVYASLENHDYKTAKEIRSTLRNHWLTGNTGILYTKNGMYVQDNPKLEDGRLLMNEETLEGKLGKHEEKGVVFSNDKSIRFTPYNYKKELQSALALSQNTGVIALTGSEENAEKIARASKHYEVKPYFWTLSNVDSPQTKVAGLGSGSFGDRLYVVADGSGDGVSFGVFDKDTAGVAKK